MKSASSLAWISCTTRWACLGRRLQTSMPDMGALESASLPITPNTAMRRGPRRRSGPLDDGIVGDAVVLPGRPALVSLSGGGGWPPRWRGGISPSPPPRFSMAASPPAR